MPDEAITNGRTGSVAGRFGRLRTGLVLEVLSVIALTAGMMVRLGIFQSRRVANDRLKKLCDLQKIKRIALVKVNDVGPYEYLYSRRMMKADIAQHNAELSLFLLHFLGTFEDTGTEIVWTRGAEIIVGYDVDQELLPDATLIVTVIDKQKTEKTGTLTLKKLRIHVEWDRGTMSYQQIVGTDKQEGRWDKYIGCKDRVLWIGSTETRKRGFMERSNKVKSCMSFASAEAAIRNPFDKIWSSWKKDENGGGEWVLKRAPRPVVEPPPVQVVVQEN